MVPRAFSPRILAPAVALTAGALVVLSLLIWLAGGLEELPVSFGGGMLGIGGLVVAPLAYLSMGSILASRLPRNPIGWMFLLAGVALATMLPVNLLVASVHHALRPAPPEVVAVAWLRNTFATPVVVTVLILAALHFPTGRPVGPRWRAATWLAILAGTILAATAAADPEGMVSYPSIANPTAVPAGLAPLVDAARVVGVALLVACAGIAVASLAARYRGGDALVRVQLRWVILAVALAALAAVPFLISRYLMVVPEPMGELLSAGAQIGSSTFPVATAIAISRFRLFDIDVLLGRTLVYLPLMAVLGGLYTASIAFFQRLFVALTGETSDTAIVLTVLVVAAAFTPVRRALESLVERRFALPGAERARGEVGSTEAGSPGRAAADPSPLRPSVLLTIGSDGRVPCPLDGRRNVSTCLSCPYLRAVVRDPQAAVVCSPP